MKKIITVALWVLTLAGCNYGTMVVESYDGRTGKSTTTTYSKYYDTGVWLVPDKLGLVVAVDYEKKNIPVVHGVQQSLGALGSGDSFAAGKVTLYLWNFDTKTYPVKFISLSSLGDKWDFQGQVMVAQPKDRTGTEAGHIRIFSYGKEIDATITLEVAGKQRRIELKLPRRTVPQLTEFFAPGGHRPYPWGDRKF